MTARDALDRLHFLYAERDSQLASAKAEIIRKYAPAIALRSAQFDAAVTAKQQETILVDL